MTSEMAVEYVRQRAKEGVGSREAARRAGYSGGTPSESARLLWEAYQQVQSASHEELVECMEQIPRRERELARLRRLETAMRIASGEGV